MILKFEDYIYDVGSKYEYIDSSQIIRIRIKRKRIYIYLTSLWNAVYIPSNKHNMEELKKIDKDVYWE